jgi:tetratricopeptide (TPR) repeat protein
MSIAVAAVIAHGASNKEAWHQLINNEPLKAEEIFSTNVSAANPAVAGEACRGLAATAAFLGDHHTAMTMTFKSFLADHDTLLLDAGWLNTLSFGRSLNGHFVKEGYDVLRYLTREPALLGGDYPSSLVERLVNDGQSQAAAEVAARLNIVRGFCMIGPFDNISGSGYRKQYPPEQELNFDSTYSGKDGAFARWFPFYNTSPEGWVFTQYNYTAQNAVLYYYANLRSTVDQLVHVGFGASGTFKVFLNDNLIMADSVFRNTGTDVFMQKVRLFKGDNKLLIKIGHEVRYSNFLIRFMDDMGRPPAGLSYSQSSGAFQRDTTRYSKLLNTPKFDQVSNSLLRRMNADSTDIEAAMLLMEFYNATEFTEEGQRLARRLIARYPRSSLLHEFYSESLIRGRKFTEAQTEIRTAYKLCKLNASAWANELDLIAENAGGQEALKFIDSSPERFKTTSQALLMRFAYYMKKDNEAEGLKVLDQLEKQYGADDDVTKLLSTFYLNQGNARKAQEILRRQIKFQRSWSEGYAQLAGIFLKMGQAKKAFATYQESLRFSPIAPGYYYFLANLSLQMKKPQDAGAYIDKALAIMPTSDQLLNLKGTILAAQNRTPQAMATLEASIGYHYDNFNAWDQLLSLQGKKPPLSALDLPDTDSLIARAFATNLRSTERGTVLARYRDVVMYPSRCSRERTFIMVYLPTQNAIDIWKEYSVPYNSYYQTININRAFSKSAAGKETPADVERNQIVFKALQPGDCIVLEWTLENSYEGEMARHVWGEFTFDLGVPSTQSVMRLVSPAQDTIPYTLQGDSITTTSSRIGEFSLVTFSRGQAPAITAESFMRIDPPTARRVAYSTFSGWGKFVDWYLALTENKLDRTSEITTLADSLYAGAATPGEKVRRMHRFVLGAIRYSYIPFRQSAWIPQAAQEVLATRIGDCKDMASLGKTLLDCAGVRSDLVLVNTRDQNGTDAAFIGPNFNHCILSYEIDGTRSFIDLTDNSGAYSSLPKMDQGAVGLVIRKGNDSLTHLPVDPPQKRCVMRSISSTIDSSGALSCTVRSIKTGIFASQIRGGYRFRSYTDQANGLAKTLGQDYPDAVVDTLVFKGLDQLGDSVEYEYRFRSKKATNFSANTAILALDPPDKLSGEEFPNEEPRISDIDMVRAWFDIGTFSAEGTVGVPAGWRLITTPPPVKVQSAYGSYELRISQKGTTITYCRKAVLNCAAPIAAADSPGLRDFLSKIAQADNVQLMFFTK